MLCVYLINSSQMCIQNTASLSGNWRTKSNLETFKEIKERTNLFFFLLRGLLFTVVTNVLQNPEVGSAFWRMPLITCCLRLVCIGLHAITWQLLPLSLFLIGEGRKNKSHGFSLPSLIRWVYWRKCERNFQTWFLQAGGDSLIWWVPLFFLLLVAGAKHGG